MQVFDFECPKIPGALSVRLVTHLGPSRSTRLDEDGVVDGAEFVAGALVEELRGSVFLIDEEAERLAARQKSLRQLRHTAQAITFAPFVWIDPDAFEVHDCWRVGDDVGFEEQGAVLHQYPGAAVFNATSAALAKALRISL